MALTTGSCPLCGTASITNFGPCAVLKSFNAPLVRIPTTGFYNPAMGADSLDGNSQFLSGRNVTGWMFSPNILSVLTAGSYLG